MKNSSIVRCVVAAIAASALLPVVHAADPLREGFIAPPDSARPRVWWHWMNGNVTKEGIAKDLTWLKSVGIGGVQNFDANLQTPQVVDKRLVYMQPDWKDAFRFAVTQADRLGLEFAIAASPGWSETGGPWVPPADGLKKVVWSTQVVEGGARFTGKLPAPPQVSGPFQDLPLVDVLASLQGDHGAPAPRHYADIAVLAVPENLPRVALLPTASANDGSALNAALLSDGQFSAPVTLARTKGPASPLIQLRYSTPQTIRAVTLHMQGGAQMFSDAEFLPVLEVRDRGAWRVLATLPTLSVPTTVSFEPVKASEFRAVFKPNTQPERLLLGEGAAGVAPFNLFAAAVAAPLQVTELKLHADPVIHRFEAKAGFSLARDYYALESGSDEPGVPTAQVIDLTSRLKQDGSLDWIPPTGRWRVLRMGYSLLGTTNHPATPEATGLEVDKFDGPAVRRYLETYLGMYRDAVGSNLMGRRGLGALLTDSIEVGAANWTPQLRERFRALRGYDPLPWLPALTGVVIESRARSDAFLYDYRRTLADLMASEHYGTVATVARENGLRLYGEALEDGRPSLGDDMAMRAHADVPMAALWVWNRGFAPRPTLLGDMKGASSVAHVYGRPHVAAESMTAFNAPWAFAPSDLRRVIDLAFAHGINRPVIHTSVHQPVDDRQPGLSLAIFGQYFTRHETWAGMARPWIDYLARSSYLLQQGRDVADMAYFYGEEQPLTALYARAPLNDVPVRHAFDFVNAEILLKEMSVQEGELVTRGGARYRALYLGGSSRRMTLPVLERLAALVESGATVIGEAPASSPALTDDKSAYAAILKRLWTGEKVASIGRGRVISERAVEAGLAVAGVRPDFHFQGAADSSVLFVHRRSDDAEIYFVNNRQNRAESVEGRFRVTGRRPELWRADKGTTEPLSWRVENGETVIPLEFAPEDSFFIVFRQADAANGVTLPRADWREAAALVGAWDVAFQAGRGAPATLRLPALQPLERHADGGVRYFSGVATYSREFELPAGVAAGQALKLDLGSVGDVAEVRVNGQMAGTAWHTPWQLDIGALTRAGRNTLEVRVANLWVNRLIGDAQPGAQKITFTTLPTYLPAAPLRPSGLIGPVRLLVPAVR
jgi:alpha-L-rhamnosidase